MNAVGSLQQEFAAVEKFYVETVLSDGYAVTGFAAPSRGTQPCALMLVANGELLAVTVAGDFSSTAQAAGIRLGWCGFEIGDLPTCALLQTTIELRCIASNRLLQSWSRDALAEFQSVPRRVLSVAAFRQRLRRPGACYDVAHVLPFGEHHRWSSDDRAFLIASYRWAFERIPTSEELDIRMAAFPPGWTVSDCWFAFCHSDEARRRQVPPLPGPFRPSFPFSLALLDKA